MLLFLASVALAAWVTRANYNIMRVDLVFLAFLALAPLLHRVRFSAGLERGDGHVNVRVRFGFVPAERELFTKTVVLSMTLNVFLLLAWETAMQLSPSLSVHYALQCLLFLIPVLHLLLFRGRAFLFADICFGGVMAALCAAEDFFRSLDTSIEFFLYLLRRDAVKWLAITLAYGALWGVYRAVKGKLIKTRLPQKG